MPERSERAPSESIERSLASLINRTQRMSQEREISLSASREASASTSKPDAFLSNLNNLMAVPDQAAKFVRISIDHLSIQMISIPIPFRRYFLDNPTQICVWIRISIVGLVVEYTVAIGVTRVRFPDDAFFVFIFSPCVSYYISARILFSFGMCCVSFATK